MLQKKIQKFTKKVLVAILFLLLSSNLLLNVTALASDPVDVEGPPEPPSEELLERQEKDALFRTSVAPILDACGPAVTVGNIDDNQLIFHEDDFKNLKCDKKRDCTNKIFSEAPENMSGQVAFLAEVGNVSIQTWNEYYLPNQDFDYNCNLRLEEADEKRALAAKFRDECLEAIKKTDTATGTSGQHYKTYYENYIAQGVEGFLDKVSDDLKACFEKKGNASLADEIVLDIPYISEYYNVGELLAGGQTNNLADTNVQGGPIVAFIVKIMNLLIRLVGIASLLMLVVGAYLLLTAAGGEEQIGKGKNTIVYALVGMAIVIFSFIIVTFVQAIVY